MLISKFNIFQKLVEFDQCPFDFIYVVWNPNLKSIDEWAKNVDSDSYSNPSNVSWNVPLPIPKMYSLLEKENLKD